MTHREQLVYAESEDGYLLEGASFIPADGGKGKLPVVWMHGFTGSFYERHTVAIGRRLASLGHAFVTGNNRGHNLGANIGNLRGGDSMRGGAWWERFEESPLDYSGWIAFTVGLGFPRVVLVGHSLGAMKAVYYMGTRGDDRVAALVSASGPIRIGYDPDRVAAARNMVADGRGRELMPDDGTSMSTSAQTLVARADTDMDVYGVTRADAPVGRVRCPILFVLGSEEPGIAVKDDLPTLTRNARSAARADALYVEGANHIYTNRERQVADGIAEWIAKLG